MATASTRRVTLVVVAVAALFGVAIALLGAPGPATPAGATDALDTFDSEADFRAYLAEGASLGVGSAGGAGGAPTRATGDAGGDGGDGAARPQASTPAPQTTSGSDGRRVGTTNVQVGGVDEPDILKTDGDHFYYAPNGRAPVPSPRADALRPVERPGNVSVLGFGNVTAPSIDAEINASGQLVRSGDTLVVLERRTITAYDISTPAAPTESWTHELKAGLVTGRLVDGQLYLVLVTPIDQDNPCPIDPLGGAAGVDCDDVHHPTEHVSVGATYTTVAIEPESGAVTGATGIVGTRAQTAVYAGTDRLYLTYTRHKPRAELILDFTLNASETVPREIQAELRSVRETVRSTQDRLELANEIVVRWLENHSQARENQLRAQLQTELGDYLEANRRTMTRSGVVGIELSSDLPVVAHGTVPGEPLDQFSLSRHDGTLRIATTVPGYGAAESVNDLYTLDATTLERLGAVQGMAPGQEIFAARYVGETGYLVTFRQVDPFHVIDLSDPESPAELGQVKLPGFSRYLHPITDERILGIGEEDGRVKAVTFDASTPTDPVVEDDLVLNADFSAIARTHHAFTIDRRHGVFFLPTGEAGVVVDYTDGELAIHTRVQVDGGAQRARYVGDYLYVFGGTEVVVLDETDWEVETRLALTGGS